MMGEAQVVPSSRKGGFIKCAEGCGELDAMVDDGLGNVAVVEDGCRSVGGGVVSQVGSMVTDGDVMWSWLPGVAVLV